MVKWIGNPDADDSSMGWLVLFSLCKQVLPVVEDDGNTTDDLVDEKDVKTEVMRSRGAGGQVSLH